MRNVQTISPESGTEAGGPIWKKPEILIVEDSPDFRSYLDLLLGGLYRIRLAPDSVTALRLFSELAPDLVLSDVMMPGENGFELVRRIRSSERNALVPIILFSGRADEEFCIEGLDAGADDFIIKPFSGRELLARIRTRLKMAEARRTTDLERAKARVELDRMRGRAEGILESISDIFMVVGEDWKFEFLNQHAQRVFGRAKQGWNEATLWEQFPQLSGTPGEVCCRDAMERRQSGQFETEQLLPGRSLEVCAYPILNGISLYCRDITGRKQAEASVQQLNRELEQRVQERTASLREVNTELEAFTYSVSHDLRAPIRSIRNFAEILEGEFGSALSETAGDFLRRIIRAACTMDELVLGLLEYSRTSRLQLDLVTVDLDSVWREVLERQQPALLATAPDLLVREPLGKVQGHPLPLVQSLENLLLNAMKFVPAGSRPRLEIWSEQRGEHVRLHIRDNGIGIAPEHQQAIFGIFERLHDGRTYPGSGIGLAIVRKGIERIGGEVGVESALGQGSTFWVDLPEAAGEAAGAARGVKLL